MLTALLLFALYPLQGASCQFFTSFCDQLIGFAHFYAPPAAGLGGTCVISSLFIHLLSSILPDDQTPKIVAGERVHDKLINARWVRRLLKTRQQATRSKMQQPIFMHVRLDASLPYARVFLLSSLRCMLMVDAVTDKNLKAICSV